MKPFHLLVGLFLVTGASAQTPSTTVSSGEVPVTVVDNGWRQAVFVPALYADPMQANQDHNDLLRDQRNTAKENAIRAKTGENQIPLPTKKIAQNTPVGSTPMGVAIGDEPIGNKNQPAPEEPGDPKIHYVYEATIKNNSTKTIRSVLWQYLVFEPETETPVGAHRFNTPAKIRPGKTGKLIGKAKSPPSRVVRANKKTSKNVSDKFKELIFIEQIEYDDGTFWQRVPN